MATEDRGIYFTELTLKNVRCFGDEAVLKLSNDKGEWSRWNVILGDNGTGKTTLLQCLAGMELQPNPNLNEDVSLDLKNYSTEKGWTPKLFLNNKAFFYNTKYNEISEHRSKTFVSNEKVRVLIKSIIYSEATQEKVEIGFGNYETLWRINWRITTENEHFKSLFILGYGANRSIDFQILSEKEIESENSGTLFDDDAKLINAEEWLLQIDYGASRNSEIKQLAIKRRDLIIDCLLKILPDVESIKFKNATSIDRPVPKIEFKTPFGWVSIKELSFGYKTMVAWIVDLAARVFKQYPGSENPLEEPVIILVDEIDLHLHPKWQRQIFDFLETRFPRAQFIVTAHSPLIVQSAPKDANIIVLKKEQVGDEYVVRIDNDTKSVWNWRIDQIMSSDIFGLNTSRSPEIERQMNERTMLIQKGRDNLSEEQKERLDELNDLSRSLPTADSPDDIEAMELIRKAAKFIKEQNKVK